MNADELKERFDRYVAKPEGIIHAPFIGMAAGFIENATGGTTKDMKVARRREVLFFLTGKLSMKELSDAQLNAIFHFVFEYGVGGFIYKSQTDKWAARENLPALVGCILETFKNQDGQVEMPFLNEISYSMGPEAE